MRPRQQAADVEAQPAAWIDDRLASDKLHKQHTQHAQQRRNDGMVSYILRVAILLLLCYMIGVQQLAFTALTSVQCTPQAVLAGSNVTCVITTSPHATETALSVTQVTSGQAGPLFQLEDHAHSHRVTSPRVPRDLLACACRTFSFGHLPSWRCSLAWPLLLRCYVHRPWPC